MSTKKTISLEEKEKIYGEIIKGKVYRKIAKEYDISIGMVSNVKKELESFFAVKPKQPIKRTRTSRKKQKEAILAKRIYDRSDIIIGNILNVGRTVILGAEKVLEIADKSDERVKEIVFNLNNLNKLISENTCFEDGNDSKTLKANLIKEIHKTIDGVSSYYATNKIVIEAVRELRKHAEAYSNLKAEADSLTAWTTFFDAIFEGCEVLSDAEYIKFRDLVINKSEMGKQMFAKYDPQIVV